MLSRIDRYLTMFGLTLGLLAVCQAAMSRGDEPSAKNWKTPLRVLILTDRGEDDARSTAPHLRKILSETGRFQVRTCESPVGLTASTLDGFDVVVDDIGGGSPGGETEDAIAGFVESGKGLVVTHSALSAASRHPKTWPLTSSGTQIGPVHFFEVKIFQPEHPIVKGLKSTFRTADALPTLLRNQTFAQVLAAAGIEGRVDGEPVLFSLDVGKGRLVGIALGHDAAAIHESSFASLFARSCEWSATGSVTLPTDFEPSGPSVNAVKALLITGGHDHETAFYSLFNGDQAIDWLPVSSSTTVFKNDLRGKYQVVIMYDFTRELDEHARKNLRDYVESGGGVVILHHALLNYQNWNWWDDEVVGGSYRLTKPSSAVKDDQQIYVSPVGDHPILAGIGPFHIQDEAYKNLRMSPKIRPLLTTDNPTSDKHLAWLGPDDRYRVVAIQLGHGHSAFGHPTYRALVHNAILWASGKTK